ncbi:MAG: hypothetical protein CBD21_00765 [bacterium TMED161]|nr:hypothetical protein [Candidatus Neomarinimicrobiota bacterium]OUW21471.1 MAG: hypothetical protein CBD21_00765 [bacterium TMED161]
MKYLFSIIFFVSALFSNVHINNSYMLSTGFSNISSYLLDNEEVFYAPHISLGFSRTDNIKFTSEFGLEYGLKSNNSSKESEYLANKNLFGLRLFSSISYQLSICKIGFKSLIDLSFPKNSFIFGPSIAYLFKVGTLNLNISYFKGCADFINFSKFTDNLELQIYFGI